MTRSEEALRWLFAEDEDFGPETLSGPAIEYQPVQEPGRLPPRDDTYRLLDRVTRRWRETGVPFSLEQLIVLDTLHDLLEGS